MKKRIFSRILALVMAVSLLSTTAFAASFADLQNAIDGKEGQSMDNGHTGYAWNDGLKHWGIEAWDQEGTRNVQLNETVERNDIDKGLSISGSGKDVTIDLNGQTIDGNNLAGSVIAVTDGGKLTVEDSSGKDETGKYVSAGEGKITGGTGEDFFKNPDGALKAGGGVFIKNSEFTLNGGNITENKSNFGGGIAMSDGANVTITNGAVSGNTATNHGGGIYHYGSVYPDSSTATLTISGGTISNNKAEDGAGGAIFAMAMFSNNAVDIKINNAAIENNSSAAGWTAGAIYLSGKGQKNLEIVDSTVYGNSGNLGGALYVTCDKLTIKNSAFGNNSEAKTDNNFFCEGISSVGTKDISGLIVENTDGTVTIVNSEGKVIVTAPEGKNIQVDSEKGLLHIPAGGTLDGTTYEYGAIADRTGKVIYVFPAEVPDVPVTPEMPVDTVSAATTIEDEETPLAGLVSAAQLLEELRQYEGVEDIELPEDFQWIDHEFAQAIYWGLNEALVVDTEDDPLDPDEIVTVALLREVLENFVAYKGLTDFVVTVEGEDDMIVMDLGERLTVFYGELEAALEAKAA